MKRYSTDKRPHLNYTIEFLGNSIWKKNFFLGIFIEVLFICHKIHEFEVNSLKNFGNFIQLNWLNLCNWDTEKFPHAKKFSHASLLLNNISQFWL